MTALEKLLAAYKSADPVQLAATPAGSSPNPTVHDVDNPDTASNSASGDDAIPDETWDALQTTLTNNAEAVSVSPGLTGVYSDMQAAVTNHDEMRLQTTIYLLRAKSQSCYTTAACDSAIAAVSGAAMALLNRDQPTSDDASDVMPMPMNW